jgi:hypothetical protein
MRRLETVDGGHLAFAGVYHHMRALKTPGTARNTPLGKRFVVRPDPWLFYDLAVFTLWLWIRKSRDINELTTRLGLAMRCERRYGPSIIGELLRCAMRFKLR